MSKLVIKRSWSSLIILIFLSSFFRMLFLWVLFNYYVALITFLKDIYLSLKYLKTILISFQYTSLKLTLSKLFIEKISLILVQKSN